ncbi:hypothetical protein EJ04DRAFT_52481 [Polyplosphaeria fusca]|uniref:C2H2-type domain-containing protein n=1 Tax=Polyplosphaeria fusca TaxID=682080 RepID=A0A9P4R3D8_9PLEO|nr:hypothetical protein EJ04DRAFT_52481 [Polyplosphaeria fusca]
MSAFCSLATQSACLIMVVALSKEIPAVSDRLSGCSSCAPKFSEHEELVTHSTPQGGTIGCLRPVSSASAPCFQAIFQAAGSLGVGPPPGQQEEATTRRLTAAPNNSPRTLLHTTMRCRN